MDAGADAEVLVSENMGRGRGAEGEVGGVAAFGESG